MFADHVVVVGVGGGARKCVLVGRWMFIFYTPQRISYLLQMKSIKKISRYMTGSARIGTNLLLIKRDDIIT